VQGVSIVGSSIILRRNQMQMISLLSIVFNSLENSVLLRALTSALSVMLSPGFVLHELRTNNT